MARPFRVTYVGRRGARVSIDISHRVNSIDKWLDVGSGEVSQCQLMLDCRGGAFLTDAGGGATPIVRQYDELEVRMGYADGTTQRRVFFVNRVLPQREGDSVRAQLEMFGREAHLRTVFHGGRYTSTPYLSMLRTVVAELTAGTAAVGLVESCNVPAWPVGTVDFGDGAMSVYDAIMLVLGRLNLPASAGGANDVHSLTFEEHSLIDGITYCVRSQGSRNAASTPPTLDADADADFIECTQIHEREEASRVRVRGRQDFGSLPLEYAEWRSAVEEWLNYPAHVSGRLYAPGALVRHADVAWRRRDAAAASVASPPDSATWERVDVHDLLPTGFNYSPWTAGKAMAWQNMASNPSENRARGYSSPAYPDANLQIRDDGFSRDWVHFGPLSSLADAPDFYLAEHAGQRIAQDGMRVLCGPGWAGSDRHGRAYANSVAVDVGGDLVVTKSAAGLRGGQAHERGDEVAVLSTGKVWEWQRRKPGTSTDVLNDSRESRMAYASGALGWRDVTDTPLGSDCFHRPKDIENVQGFLGRDVYRTSSATASNSYAHDSAVRITYEADVGELLASSTGLLVRWAEEALGPLADWLGWPAGLSASDLLLTRDWNIGAMGWWATLFMAPGPPRTQGTAVTSGEFWPSHLLNLNNLDRLLLENDTSGELGETSGIAFIFEFEILVGGARVGFQGDFPFKIIVQDSEGNTWEKDEVVRFQGEAQQIRARWSEFRIRRSRTPIALSNILTNIAPPERLELEQLNERRVKMITMQFDRPYDEFGRYNPAQDYVTWIQSLLPFTGGRVVHRGTIDGLHFMKPPVAVATGDAHASSSPVRDYSDVSNVRQLRAIAATELEVAEAQVVSYTIKYKGRADINLDDTVYYHDSLTVPATVAEPRPANTSQRKLAVTRVLHSATQGGGWVTTITAVDRLGD